MTAESTAAVPALRPADRLPDELRPYRRTSIFTEASVPKALLQAHSTKKDVWGLIHVLEGRLAYRIVDERRIRTETVLTPHLAPGVVEPEILHEIAPDGPVRFIVEFYAR